MWFKGQVGAQWYSIRCAFDNNVFNKDQKETGYIGKSLELPVLYRVPGKEQK